MVTLYRLSALCGAILATCVSAQAPPTAIDPNFFPSLTPRDTLTWVDCYDGFQCARLRVPADVTHPKRREKVEIAVVKLPAVGGNRTGSVVFSLGGFSASNTNAVIQIGRDFATLYPNLDVIGIDRRGTGYSTPSIRCFPNQEARVNWQRTAPPVLGSSRSALPAQRARAKRFAQNCARYSGNALKWSGTYPSAVDMYTVMRAMGDKKISFYGFSSGTHTAQTFAALYPEAVDKFVLDGVVRSDLQYTVSDDQPSTVVDSELALDGFFTTCVAAGPEACPFLGNSTTPAQLRRRYEAIDRKFKRASIPNAPYPPFDYSALHNFVGTALGDSFTFFPQLAGLLAELEAGQAGPATGAASAIIYAEPAPLPPLGIDPPFDLIIAGVCMDPSNVGLKNNRDFQRYLDRMLATSPAVGGIVAQNTLFCSEWKVKPINVFPRKLLSNFCGTKIAGHILYISNTADYITPLDSAIYMKTRFFKNKATNIIDHAVGHTAISTGALSGNQGYPSLGVFDIIFRFFNLNQIPTQGSVYLPDFPPFLAQGADYAGLLPSGFGGVVAPAYPIPGKTPQ
ncbi:hypothetical protein M501DRAFT_1061629 [Patellaria atrata CBS 101060]|uniref:AB hydrolase-1 domain-containing protein n=1 Tax=Patellaria atrata CBS 101060 TaxID=1346257 RepID=A0A9P4VLW5_9PEZI|nr:hypothetical protein M501DRAFT_1061629 [Patellaria atrata CBS 101060]